MTNKTVAILGHRGIPASYGGFETLAEQLSRIFSSHGLEVVNYCRRYLNKGLNFYGGSRLIYLPAWHSKSLETLSHSFFATIHLYFNPVDYVLVLNVGNAIFAWLLKLRGIKVLLNVDGFEWQRKKWGRLARSFFKASAWLAIYSANALITDSDAVKDFYKNKYGKESIMISYGANALAEEDLIKGQKVLAAYGLQAKKYLLYLARFEPENNALLVRLLYEEANLDLPLVMVGDAPYASDYIKKVKATVNPRIKFLNSVYGIEAEILMANALAYIRAAEAGGVSPAVIQAMANGTCVIVNDTPANHQAAGEAALYYNLNDDSLTDRLRLVVGDQPLALNLGSQVKARALSNFSWQKIGEQYLSLIKSL